MSGPDQTRQKAVFDHLRQSILTGTLPPSSRLPPTRSLAQELGVARQTVVLAYERLAAEGYVRGRTGSGTYVADDLPDQAPAPAAAPRLAAAVLSRRGRVLADVPATATAHEPACGLLLAGGLPAPDLFPAAAWQRCANQVLKALPHELAGYPPPQGLPALREQIAARLATSRGLIADPACIIVTSGTQQALRTAADLLLDPGDPVWVEEPGYIAGRGALLAAGARLIPVPTDHDGMNVAHAIESAPGARLALVAPSHATPLGGTLPVGRRLALLDWAYQHNAWVLEDDCDSEFRWESKPLPPLATLDRAGQVIYCGTFSKTLAPALRIGFAVVPAPLVAAFVRLRTLADRGTEAFTQATLAAFMRQGLLAPHIRRVRTAYAARRQALLEALARHAPAVAPLPAPGGLHMVARLPDGMDEAGAVLACRQRNLAVSPLHAYYNGPPAMTGLVLGFATTPVGLAADAARRLQAALLTLPAQPAPCPHDRCQKAGAGGRVMFHRLDQAHRLTGNQYKIIAAAIIGDMLEFFDYFLIGFVLAFIIKPWNLTFGQSAIILLSSGIGAVLGAAVWGRLADLYGRRKVFIATIVNFSLASGILAFTPEHGWIYLSVFRFFVGFGVGGLYCVDLPLVQEFMPARMRGFVGGMVTVFIPLGVMIASSFAAFATGMIGWRGLFLVGLIPALFTLVVRAWVPESPHWLARRGRATEARASLAWALKVPPESLPLPAAETAEPHPAWRELFRYPRSMAVAFLASLGAQTASYGITLWAPTLFMLQIGVTPAYAAYLFLYVTAAGICGRVVFAWLSDAIGRRNAGMLAGFGGAIAIAAAAALHDVFLGTTSVFWLCVVLGDFFFDGGFAVIGPYLAEVWPVRLRTTGMGAAYGFGGLGKIIGPLGLALIVGSSNIITPKATLAAIGPAFAYFAGWMALCGFAFLFFGFETGGRTIGAIDLALDKAQVSGRANGRRADLPGR
jgi:DNA-binding transcriptional MocR family regulator/MFS family permease